MLALLALLAALTGTGALYFDCFMQTTTETCERSEYCVWLEAAQQCALSAQSHYLLCLEDMRIPEETCLPASSQHCNLTHSAEYCNLQIPCSWKEANATATLAPTVGNATTANATAPTNATATTNATAPAGCLEHVYEPWTEVPTASPTQSPKQLPKYSRAERVKCCAHTWRVCFPTAAMQAASESVKAHQLAQAKQSCNLPSFASMNDLCVQARTNLKCPTTRAAH